VVTATKCLNGKRHRWKDVAVYTEAWAKYRVAWCQRCGCVTTFMKELNANCTGYTWPFERWSSQDRGRFRGLHADESYPVRWVRCTGDLGNPEVDIPEVVKDPKRVRI